MIGYYMLAWNIRTEVTIQSASSISTYEWYVGDTNADMINAVFYFSLQGSWYSIINLFVSWFISLRKSLCQVKLYW